MMQFHGFDWEANRRLGSLDVEETARERRLAGLYQLRTNSVAVVTWLDKQLITATMETAVTGTAINYSYHANV